VFFEKLTLAQVIKELPHFEELIGSLSRNTKSHHLPVAIKPNIQSYILLH
jgi:hypothetical protein